MVSFLWFFMGFLAGMGVVSYLAWREARRVTQHPRFHHMDENSFHVP